MKKTIKTLSIILAIVMIIVSMPVFSFAKICDILTSSDGLWTYVVLGDGTISITGRCSYEFFGDDYPAYLGSDEDVYIPSEIDGYTVSTVGLCAEINEETDEITTYRPACFTFAGDFIKNIYIPETVVNFAASFTLNTSEGQIDECVNLENIFVDENNPVYASIDGVLYDKNITKLVAYPIGKKDKEYTIPATIVNPSWYGLRQFPYVETLYVLSDGTVSSDTFSGFTALKTIYSYDSKNPNVNWNKIAEELGVEYISLGPAPCQHPGYSCEWVVTTPATCTEEGVESYVCLECGEIVDTRTIPAGGHDYSDYELYENFDNSNLYRDTCWNSCDGHGTMTVTCKRCGETVSTKDLPSWGHVSSGWVQNKDGVLEKHCVVCGKILDKRKQTASDTQYAWQYFPDVSKSDWFASGVDKCFYKRIISGYSNGYFGPNNTIQRQDFAIMLARLDNADLTTIAEKYQGKFPDVTRGSYYESAAIWSQVNGYICGYNSGYFGVGDSITREQIVTILYRYFGSPAVNNVDKTLSGYSDAKNISDFARVSMAWAVQSGIIYGRSSTRLAPQGTATRAEAAAMFTRYIAIDVITSDDLIAIMNEVNRFITYRTGFATYDNYAKSYPEHCYVGGRLVFTSSDFEELDVCEKVAYPNPDGSITEELYPVSWSNPLRVSEYIDKTSYTKKEALEIIKGELMDEAAQLNERFLYGNRVYYNGYNNIRRIEGDVTSYPTKLTCDFAMMNGITETEGPSYYIGLFGSGKSW